MTFLRWILCAVLFVPWCVDWVRAQLGFGNKLQVKKAAMCIYRYGRFGEWWFGGKP